MSAHSFSISENAVKRVSHLLSDEPAGSMLRIEVLGGGCSGFQYKFDFDAATPEPDETIITHEGQNIAVIDPVSLEMLSGGMLDYAERLGASAFEITNPNASAACGCGNSFAM